MIWTLCDGRHAVSYGPPCEVGAARATIYPHEALDWCRDHLSGYALDFVRADIRSESGALLIAAEQVVFAFAARSDAVLFLLRWGDQPGFFGAAVPGRSWREAVVS